MVSFNIVFKSKVQYLLRRFRDSDRNNPSVARETNKGASLTSVSGSACLWDAYCSSVCPRYHTDTRAYPFSRVRGKSRPGPTPFLFSRPVPPVLYFLLHAGIPDAALYALLLKGACRFPPPSLGPATILSAPFVPPLGAHAWDHVSLSINDFYGLPSSSRTFLFFFFPTYLSSLGREKKEGRQRFSMREVPPRGTATGAAASAEVSTVATNYYDQLNNSCN